MRRGALALVAVGFAGCPIFGSLGEWGKLGAGTTGSGGAAGATSTVATGGGGASASTTTTTTTTAGTGGANEECAPSTLGTGAPVWSQGYGDPSDQSAGCVAIDGAGDVFVAGIFQGSVDFGCGTLTSPGQGGFIAKLSPTGACLWSKGFGSTMAQPTSIAVDTAGDVILTGSFEGTIDFGSGALTAVGTTNVFFAKLDSSGAAAWSERFGDGESEGGTVAVDPTGNILTVGAFSGSIDFGGSTTPIDLGTNGGGFIAKLDPGGAAIWSEGIANAGGTGIAADSFGNALLTGGFKSSVDLGGCPLTAADPTDGFVAKLDPSGACMWSKGLGTAIGTSLAVDATGAAVVTGAFIGSVTFGESTFTSPSAAENLFLVKFDASGSMAWGKGFPGAETDGASIAIDTTGDIFIVGALNGAVDLGGGTLTSAGGEDVLLASFDAAGGYRWAKRFGNPQQQDGLGVAVDSSCHVVMVGEFQDTFDFGGNPIASAGGYDAFVAQFVR